MEEQKRKDVAEVRRPSASAFGSPRQPVSCHIGQLSSNDAASEGCLFFLGVLRVAFDWIRDVLPYLGRCRACANFHGRVIGLADDETTYLHIMH